jgi:hypothetical protein
VAGRGSACVSRSGFGGRSPFQQKEGSFSLKGVGHEMRCIFFTKYSQFQSILPVHKVPFLKVNIIYKVST